MRIRKKKNWLQRKEASVRRGSGRVFFFMVMKPGPDRTVRPEKPRTAHFCGSLSLKNPFMAKKNRDP